MALRLVTLLVAVSLIGTLPVRGETCEEATAPCRDSQPHPMACCQPARCCCDLSAPVQPAPNSAPTRSITGHEIVKVVSLPVDAMFHTSAAYCNVRSTARADNTLLGPVSSYLLTHAFLI